MRVCFGAAGIHGISYLGSLAVLEKNEQLIREVDTCAGCSSGSFGALVLCLGIPHHRVLQVLEHLLQTGMLRVHPSSNCLENFGLDGGQCIQVLVGEILELAGLSAAATLQTMHRLTQKHFVLNATDIIGNRLVRLDHTSYPHMPVRTAVMASCCVPFLFEPVPWDNMLLVDGCIKEKLPCDASAPQEIRVITQCQGGQHVPPRDWTAYVNCIAHAVQAEIVHPCLQIEIPSTVVGSLSINNLNIDDVRQMVQAGFACTLRHTATSAVEGLGYIALQVALWLLQPQELPQPLWAH